MSAVTHEERTEDTISLQVLTADGQDINSLVTPPAVVCGSANEPLALAIAEKLGAPLLRRRISVSPMARCMYASRAACVARCLCDPADLGAGERAYLRAAAADRHAEARVGWPVVTAIIPYYGYARQDRKFTGRDPITAKLVANLITAAGASRVLAVDLHSPAIQGFFDIGMDHLLAIQLLAEDLMDRSRATA